MFESTKYNSSYTTSDLSCLVDPLQGPSQAGVNHLSKLLQFISQHMLCGNAEWGQTFGETQWPLFAEQVGGSLYYNYAYRSN